VLRDPIADRLSDDRLSEPPRNQFAQQEPKLGGIQPFTVDPIEGLPNPLFDDMDEPVLRPAIDPQSLQRLECVLPVASE